MKIPRITGTSPTAPPDSFLPYVYGAAQGRPSKGRPEKVLLRLSSLDEGLTETGVIALERTAREPRHGRDWEAAERARLEAARCSECQALPPNHRTGCSLIPMPNPAAERCGCGYVKGSLGCRLTHGGAA